jgi:hypothetical protein
MTPVARTAVVGVAVVLAALAGRLVDFRDLAGPVKGDEATYISMALSLAADGDLLYDRGDYERFVAHNDQIPDGIFLKRAYDVDLDIAVGWPPIRLVHTPEPTTEQLSYGKALIYPLLAAPFAALGGLGGMLVFNVALLAACIVCAVRVGQARAGRWPGLVFGLAFIGATVVPIYTVWLTSELFNFTAVLVAYYLWIFKKVAPAGQGPRGIWTDVAAAALLGVATYSKLTNALLIAPIALDYLRPFRFRMLAWLGLAFTTGTVGLFGLTALTSGEWNYQGAAVASDRRTFHTNVPFDEAGTPFEVAGNVMVTNDADTGTVLAPDVLALLPKNIEYFLFGRHAGLVPYYFPAIVLVTLFIVRARRAEPWQWATLLTVAASAGALLVFAPYVWNGGGGPPGNRYFLSLYPTFLALVPAALPAAAPVVALAGGTLFTIALVLQPFQASLEPWGNPDWPPLRWLPVELTIVDDLPVRLHPKRGRVLFVRDPTVFLYYLDGATYYAEGAGFWTKAGERADIVVRTERPVTLFGATIRSRVANRVTVRFAGRTYDFDLDAGAGLQIWMEPQKQMNVHESYPYLLQVTSTSGFVPAETEAGSTDDRHLGVFVEPRFYYGSPPALSGLYAPPPDPGGGPETP